MPTHAAFSAAAAAAWLVERIVAEVTCAVFCRSKAGCATILTLLRHATPAVRPNVMHAVQFAMHEKPRSTPQICSNVTLLTRAHTFDLRHNRALSFAVALRTTWEVYTPVQPGSALAARALPTSCSGHARNTLLLETINVRLWF